MEGDNKKKQKKAGKKTSKSERAGINFPVGRISRYMKEKKVIERISLGSPVFMAAMQEYITADLLDQAGNTCQDDGKKKLTPRHIFTSIQTDQEFHDLFENTIIANGGVREFVNKELVPENIRKKERQRSKERTQKMARNIIDSSDDEK